MKKKQKGKKDIHFASTRDTLEYLVGGSDEEILFDLLLKATRRASEELEMFGN